MHSESVNMISKILWHALPIVTQHKLKRDKRGAQRIMIFFTAYLQLHHPFTVEKLRPVISTNMFQGALPITYPYDEKNAKNLHERPTARTHGGRHIQRVTSRSNWHAIGSHDDAWLICSQRRSAFCVVVLYWLLSQNVHGQKADVIILLGNTVKKMKKIVLRVTKWTGAAITYPRHGH